MMFNIENINLVAVLIAAVISMVIGYIWYSQGVFGKDWMKMMGLKESAMKGDMAKKSMMAGFVAELLTAYILAHLINILGVITVPEALQLGFWLWLGFRATLEIGNQLWGGHPMKMFYINSGYRLVSMLAMATILTTWV
ncbi:hypothetical protein A2862_03005 [Candidatus Roizmanbacteria bacterium RIFCSPHIGHO2_01_FULL_38_41]|uniref:DUF1761 domain-containing protein n=1 Tax=Candidatus Roizmanbacteria bacterium RIFCSPHIGHO2_02_FULL_37_24 TaxID=1802037 RepID=A0A1F7H0Y6_9BACT|nr:MAG: hypothetical protein A2862_03005 [Candidatus Roizmanbacteria bacterium RIFCSPHIGHO2_01_FULL_38_41]OGK24713.1 MAG: hypothetical protein A3C24_01155 [Candidatus Roizmanbacteria bacterium RIFCSPHIGHO2_02_FULL_37_24]